MTSMPGLDVRVPAIPAALRGLLHRWFVVFNPLYLASALCVLVGVWLVAEPLTASGSVYGDLWLTGVIELYQVALIGGTALLYRSMGQVRPAVMLALLAVMYACDPTFRVENAATSGLAGVVMSAAWVALSYARFAGLFWALRLHLDARGGVLLGGGVLWLAITPQLLAHTPNGHAAILLGAYGTLVGLVLGHRMWRPTIVSSDSLTARGELILRQNTRAAWLGLAVFGLYHLASWHLAHGVGLTALHITVALLAATYWSRDELAIGAITALALLVGLAEARWPHAAALLAVGMLAVNGARLSRPRLYLGAVVVLWWGLRVQHPVVSQSLALDLAAGVLFLLVAWRFRHVPAMVLALGAGAVRGAWRLDGCLRELHLTRMQWGGALLAGGFGLLFIGLAINWKLRPDAVLPPREPTPRPPREG